MAETIIGIDLGTTNSEVAVVRNGVPEVLTEDDDAILPSYVGLAADGRLLVGRPARNQYALHPERTVRSIKRRMGEDVQVPLGSEQYRPQEISAMILKRLKERAEAALNEQVRKAVITVPAYFNDTQRQATREAGELAGLEVVRILPEPTAAALTYNPAPGSAETILVYDLGGGTFDVSIVQTEAGVLEVQATQGDAHLGGDDFDDVLMNLVADRFREQHGVDLRDDRATRARLLDAAERAKRALSDYAVARLEEEFIATKDGVDLHLDEEVSRGEYEERIRPLLDQTLDCAQRALNDAGLTASRIDQVVLVGGSTRTPLIGELLEGRLGKPAHREIHPDLCVALGAAVQGAIIAGDEVGRVLVDITPHSMGIRCLDEGEGIFAAPFEHRFARVVPRNAPLPASRSEMFSTVMDGQERVEIDVYQGEADDVRENHQIGKFMIDGLARVPAGNQILVQFDLTLDGTLEVSAREKATGLVKATTIQNALGRMQAAGLAQARQRLSRVWLDSGGDGQDESPQLEAAPREGQREAVQAKALLEKAERVREAAQPEDREELDRLAADLRAALEDREWDRVGAVSAELSDVIFYLEDA